MAGAVQRLARDLREIQTNPLPTIAAEPFGDDVRIWRVTFTAPDGPYQGVPFHMVMNFPSEYPRHPPRVQLCTHIPHPNVFDGYDFSAGRAEPGVWLCLNMLRNADTHGGEYSGWSGAYSTYSILVQLQSFLFAENIDQDGDYVAQAYSSIECIRDACDAAHAFHESHGHEFPSIADAVRVPAGRLMLSDLIDGLEMDRPPAAAAAAAAAAGGPFDFAELPEEVTIKIADQLPPQAVSALFRTCKAAAATLSRAQLAMRRELVCYFSKVPFSETVLGFGFRVEHGRRMQQQAGGARHIKSISTELELLSHDSFAAAGVRVSVWQRPFNMWLPVLLDGDHSERALPLVRQQLMAIAGYPAQAPFDPLVVLTVLPRLLNQMTVSLMSANDSTSLHASEKALLGFTSFHHLLLKLAADYPIIQERAQHWVDEFSRSRARRSKLVIHDLGEFLVLLYLCPEGSWERLAGAFLQESWLRNVRWMLDPRHGDAGVLAVLETDGSVSDYRMKRTMQASATSKRLLMFQVFFLRQVACPVGGGASPAEILQRYESSLGRPPPGTASKLQAECKEILQAELSWPRFLSKMGVQMDGPAQLCDALRAAVRQSEERGYHSSASVDWKRLREKRAAHDSAYACYYHAHVRATTTSGGRSEADDDDAYSISFGDHLSQTGSSSAAASSVSSAAVTSSLPTSGAAAKDGRFKLFVAGLRPRQTEEQLRQLCCSFGRPAAVQKQPGSASAFIWFSSGDAADAALQYLREVTVCGRPLRVERARQTRHHRHTGHRRGGGGAQQQRSAPTRLVQKCPHAPQSLAAKLWYKEHGRR